MGEAQDKMNEAAKENAEAAKDQAEAEKAAAEEAPTEPPKTNTGLGKIKKPAAGFLPETGLPVRSQELQAIQQNHGQAVIG